MTMSISQPKIIVLHPGALGDGLLSLPTIRGLRRQHPRHRLLWVGHKALGEVLLQAGEVHESFSFDFIQVGSHLQSGSPMYQSLKACDPARDLILGWMNDHEAYWTAWAKKLGYSHFIFQSPRGGQLTSLHMLERYREALRAKNPEYCSLPVQSDFRTLKLTFPKFNPAEKSHLTKFSETQPLILLHPGSGSPHKCSSPEIWSPAAKSLMRRWPEQVGFIGGPADTKYLDPILSMLIDMDPLCFRDLDLLTVCGLFQQVKLFIGHDSGLSHLAANLGVPTLLVFGPTDPEVWAPRGAHIRVRRDRDLYFSPEVLCVLAEQLMEECQRPLVA